MADGGGAAGRGAAARAERLSHGTRITLLGLLVNSGLALIKLLAGIVGHSYALIADAIESMADIFASLVVWRGLHVAGQPADDEHPYGHGRAESLAALIVGLMLFGAGIGIAVQAVREIITPHHGPAAFTLFVLVGVVAAKEVMFRVMRRAARRAESGALLVDAWHHRSDALTSLAAGIGISIALLGGPGWEAADDWAALAASGVIVFNAARLIRVPIHELMDADVPRVAAEARRIAGGIEGVLGVEKVFARKLGVEYWVDMHLEVDPAMPVRRAHALAHAVEDAIRAGMPQVRKVLIHVEPHGPPHG